MEVAKEMENRRMITNAMLEAVRFLLKKGRIGLYTTGHKHQSRSITS